MNSSLPRVTALLIKASGHKTRAEPVLARGLPPSFQRPSQDKSRLEWQKEGGMANWDAPARISVLSWYASQLTFANVLTLIPWRSVSTVQMAQPLPLRAATDVLEVERARGSASAPRRATGQDVILQLELEELFLQKQLQI